MNQDRYFPDEGRGVFACRILMNILLLVTLPLSCGIYTQMPPVALLFSGAEMAVFALMMEIMQRTLKSFAVYTAAHLAALLLIYLAAPYFPMVHLVMAFAATIVMYSGRAMRRRDFYPEIGWICYPVMIYTVGYTGGKEGLKVLGVFAEIVIIALVFIYQNQKGLERTLNTANAYVRVPYRKIKVVNAAVFAVFAAAAVLLALVMSQLLNGEAIVTTIGRGLLGAYALITLAIVWLFSHLIPQGGGPMEGMGAVEIEAWLRTYQEEHPYLSLLWKGLQFVTLTIAMVAFVYLIYRFMVNFYIEFRSADVETDDVHLQIVNTEDRKQSRIVRERTRKPGFFSPAARVRRMYVKYIRQHPGLDRIKPSHTPTELERAVTARGDARIRELYERARYAPELTTDEDVREMKQEIRAVTG